MASSFEELTSPKTVTAPQVGDGAATDLYDKAREAANTEPGHKPECEALTNGFSYCSCGIWGAACTGVTTTLLALRGEDVEPECGWNPVQASTDCDLDKDCPVHGEGGTS